MGEKEANRGGGSGPGSAAGLAHSLSGTQILPLSVGDKRSWLLAKLVGEPSGAVG